MTNLVHSLIVISTLVFLGSAHAAVVAVNVTPSLDGGYDLDGNGTVDFRMEAFAIGNLSVGSTSSLFTFQFNRSPGFALAGRPTGYVPALAALGASESVGGHSEWADAYPNWNPAIMAYSPGTMQLWPSPPSEGFMGEFAGKGHALVGYRLTKEGMDYFGVLALELRWPTSSFPDYAQTPAETITAPGPGFAQPGTMVASSSLSPSLLDGSLAPLGEIWLGVRITGGWIETEAGRSISVSSVPEPGRAVLMLLGGVGLMTRRRRAALGAG
ncbi:MAG: PEP-CTERM sorting domain-containing protein [Verrucomicrobiaceae bacterium]|nr:PEP-CTERM sorting domain-containing protein [Verrucomicrobiaceae bacterium]